MTEHSPSGQTGSRPDGGHIGTCQTGRSLRARRFGLCLTGNRPDDGRFGVCQHLTCSLSIIYVELNLIISGVCAAQLRISAKAAPMHDGIGSQRLENEKCAI